jgi:1-acyl-sn-glycerol-3-phosphate acyltransferase
VNLRAARRAAVLGFGLLICLVRSLVSRLVGRDSWELRGRWMQESGLLVTGLLGIKVTVRGTPPQGGIVVANHLSYLDILIFGAAFPCNLVSKAEIGRWPFFGTLARCGGTLFVDRSSLSSALSVSDQIAERLHGKVSVLFFPEGTSTDGRELLRFRSRLYTPAVEAGVPITAAAIRYIPDDGSPESSLCWFGDAAFLPHLWRALGGPNFSAEVQFGEPRIYADRRSAADSTYEEVKAFRSGSLVLQ